jgi:pimeloyl-ACP methyl ester carboxylesterase
MRLFLAFLVCTIGYALLSAPASATERAGPCTHDRSVNRSDYLTVDHARLYMLIRGEHCGTPVLLWLHGGPGGAERPLFRLYNSALEQNFTVVYLDQRGAGRSFDTDADPARLTIAQHIDDLDHVIDHLRTTLGATKVILVGHSWGSALGLLYTAQHPARVEAFVGVAQFVSGVEDEQARIDFVRASAIKAGDKDALSKLDVMGSAPVAADDVLTLDALVDQFGGLYHRRPHFFAAVIEGLIRGYVGMFEIRRIIEGNNVSLRAMNDEVTALDLRKLVPAVDVPVIFMLGRYDRQLDCRLAAHYFAQLVAPHKQLIWFENSAHNIPFEEPDVFNKRLLSALSNLPH